MSPLKIPTANSHKSQSALRPLRTNSPKIIYIAVAVLLFCMAALAAISYLRSQKLRLITLRNQIERSAAPGESIWIDDWLLRRALQWTSSAALRHQLIYAKDSKMPGTNNPQEIVVVVEENDPLLQSLRSQGFTITPNASQSAWIADGKGFHTPGRGVVRIYFAALTRQR